MTTDADRVKPLEWVRPAMHLTLTRATTDFGEYRVWTHHEDNDRWFWRLDGPAKSSGDADTKQEAQAACQADYASRILAALAPAPQAADAKPVARQWRALEDGFARISWELLGRGEEAGWRELAARLPQKYQIEERDLYAAPLSPAPEGWVLVPRRPTMEMMKAARAHHEGEAYLPLSLYQAMIGAAPLPPSAVPTEPSTLRVCPDRDRICPHGIGCPYTAGYSCTDPALNPAAAQEGNGNG